MPFYYDTFRSITTSATANTEVTHFRVATVANQETARITGLYVPARFATAGGGQMRIRTNTGAAASGGTAQTPAPRNMRNPAAQTTFFNDASAITPGGTLTTRLSIGFAQTGGMGGWQAVEPAAAIQLLPGATNPVGAEIASIATGTGVPVDMTIEHTESV